MRIPDKETAKLARQAAGEGWTTRRTKRHIMFTSPDGTQLSTSTTPSDHRSQANHAAAMKRVGFVPGAHHNQRREARMAKARAQSGAEKIFAILQERPGKTMTPSQLAEMAGMQRTNVSGVLRNLANRHPEIHNEAWGEWVYRPQPRPTHADVEHTNGSTPPATDGDGTSAKPSDETAPSEETNGEVWVGQLVGTTLDAPTIAVETRPDRQPITFRSALPNDHATIFEAIAVDRQGRPVLRDENGDLWIAVQLRPAF